MTFFIALYSLFFWNIENNGFVQMIKKPTHDSGTLIDHIYVNKHLFERKLELQQNYVYFSDHDIITLFVEK